MDEAVPRSGAPKWQRARFVIGLGVPVGSEVWVSGPVRLDPVVNFAVRDGSRFEKFRHINTNVIDTDGATLTANLEHTELLARDENDFADNVPLISYEEWLTQAATAVNKSTNANPKGD